MTTLSPAEAIGIAARYAAQIRELLARSASASDALRISEASRSPDERAAPARPDASTTAIDLRT